jgi:hypothetical protein
MQQRCTAHDSARASGSGPGGGVGAGLGDLRRHTFSVTLHSMQRGSTTLTTPVKNRRPATDRAVLDLPAVKSSRISLFTRNAGLILVLVPDVAGLRPLCPRHSFLPPSLQATRKANRPWQTPVSGQHRLAVAGSCHHSPPKSRQDGTTSLCDVQVRRR